MNWYVLYTKPRYELKVYKALGERGIKAFCPTYTTVSQWSDRKKKLRKPYFQSYVFVCLDEKDRKQVFSVAGVMSYLFWLGKPAIVPAVEMRLIQEYLEGETASAVQVEHLAKGSSVCIGRGPMKGQSAVVEQLGNRSVRVILPVLGCRVVVRLADLV